MRYVFFLALLYFLSCKGDKDLEFNSNKNELVLIFNNLVPNSTFEFSSGLKSRSEDFCELGYIDSFGIRRSFCFDKDRDTLHIYHSQKILEISHKIKGLDYLYYSLAVKDTVWFTYDTNGIPILSTNNESNNFDLYSSLSVLPKGDDISIGAKLRNEYLNKIYKEKETLKSLKELNKMLGDIENLDSLYDVFQLQVAHDKKTIGAIKNQKQKSYLSDMIEKTHKLTDIMQSVRATSFTKKEFLGEEFDQFSIQDNIYFETIYKKYTKNGDSISLAELKNSNLKKFFDRLNLEKIGLNSEVSHIKYHIEEYLKKYSSKNDSVYINEFKLNQGIGSIGDLEIVNLEGEHLSLEEELKNSSTYTYIDFWASWCKPCLDELSHARKLQSLIADLPIRIFYIAVYDTKENWKEMILKHSMKDFDNSYLAINTKTSSFIRNFSIDRLPRYMIFDSDGNMLIYSASRPSSKDIYEELVAVIKK